MFKIHREFIYIKSLWRAFESVEKTDESSGYQQYKNRLVMF